MTPPVDRFHTRAPGSPDASWAVRLGVALRHARDAAHLTLRAAEERTGGQLRASTISSYERGIRVVPAERLELLAHAYGVSSEQIRARAGQHQPQQRTVIDLVALEASSEPQLAHLVERLLTERVAEESRWLRIRREDLQHVRAYDSGDFEQRLWSKGILVADPPNRELRPVRDDGGSPGP